MKVLVLIFAFYISHVLSEGLKLNVKNYPKKVKPYGNGKIQLNTGKYDFKSKHSTSAPKRKKTYTVFQVVGVPKAIQGVPDSPYFPIDHGDDHKPRVKKVLPEYPFSMIRSKRSAASNASTDDEIKDTTITTESKPVSKDDQPKETTVKPTESSIIHVKTAKQKGGNMKLRAADDEDPVEENKSKEDGKDLTTKKTTSEATTVTSKVTETTAEDDKAKSNDKAPAITEKTTKDPKHVIKTTTPILIKRELRTGTTIRELKGTTSKKDKTNDHTENSKKAEHTRSNKKSHTNDEGDGKSKDISKSVKGKSNDEEIVKRANNNAKATKNNSSGETTTKLKLKETKKETVRAKPKGKDTNAGVANVRAKNVANAPKRIVTNKGKKGAARKINKKQKGKKSKVPRNKNRKRSKKGSKTKRTNATRTAKKPKATRRLIAAREALIEDYPYAVSIQKNDQHWCSGAILNPRLVITTANCLWKSSHVSRMKVRAGSRYVDRGGQMASIQEVMKHPGWGLRKNPDNDVALVLLDRNIRFSDSVHGVDLPNRVMLPAFDDAWVTSWGTERSDGIYDSGSMTLQVYHTRLMDRAKCNNVTMRFSVVVSENFICLAQSGKTGPCTRDTGAPAVSDGILWGLASWGIRKLCGTERFPAVFSYLASHSNLDFIVNATRFLMADNRMYPFMDRYPNIAVADDD